MPGLCQSTFLAGLLLVLIWVYGLMRIPTHTEKIESSIEHIATDIKPQVPVAPIVVTTTVPAIPVASTPSSKANDSPKHSTPSKGDSSKEPPPTKGGKSKGDKSKQSDRPLITYAYAESESARSNLEFFISQGLHDAADFIFIINGLTDASQLIPNKTNIRIIERPNECFDLGAHGEVLRNDNLWKQYKKFITLNASIRGPFIPYWAKRCWSDVFLGRVEGDVKLVGMTANCLPKYHIQSMIWATDRTGMELLLFPPPGSSTKDKYGEPSDMVAMEGCYNDMHKAIHGEIGATAVIQKAGHKVDALMAAFHKSGDYEEECKENPVEDILWNGQYYGANIHPYETVFMKANRDIDPTLVNLLTEWHLQGTMNGTFAGSWDVCQ
ncbi:hypothetical protein BJ170DRAFT_701313 [Xylariales sp. AK1849]|nr:hypothetical protein BJ170DRAFT_701313 [Xylariales sp. AK1849]